MCIALAPVSSTLSASSLKSASFSTVNAIGSSHVHCNEYSGFYSVCTGQSSSYSSYIVILTAAIYIVAGTVAYFFYVCTELSVSRGSIGH